MTGLSALWLPILLSAVLVFLVSGFINMALPWHKNDYRGLPDEDKVRDALRAFALPPGDYHTPRPQSAQDMRSPEFAKKMNDGPVMMFTVMPNGPFAMGKSLALWFIYAAGIGVVAAYVAGRALPIGAPYLQVFRFAGVTAFLGYSAALWQMPIWYSRSWSTTFRATVDGLLYAFLTAGMFGWLWPR